MEIFISEQCKTLAESCILGLIFGAEYDIIRILHVLCGIESYSGNKRHILRRRGSFWLFLAGDMIYMLTVLFWTSVFLLHANYGQFRLYLAAGCLAGFCIYHYTIGRLVMYVSEAVACFLKRMVYRLIVRPCIIIVSVWCRILVFLWRYGPERLPVLFRYTVCCIRMKRIRHRFRDFVKI